jgi:AcrR family transcriptional regulator
MGTAERKEREKLEMKKAILKTATEMFLKDGLDNTSIRGIAAKMEYSVGTMYLYFKDKAALMNELMEEGFARMLAAFGQIGRQEDPYLYLRLLMHKYVEFGLKNPEYYDLMFMKEKPYHMFLEPEKWPTAMRCFQMLQDAAAACIVHRSIRYPDADSASFQIWSFLHGMVALQIKHKIMTGTKKEIQQALFANVDIFMATIATRPH